MDFIAFDLETTGVRPEENHIVEIGAVRFENGQPLDRFGMLLNPGVPMPPGASAVNGITDEMLRGQPSVAEGIEAFSAFCGALPLVAHNAPFDFKFLKEAILRYRTAAPEGPVLDSLPLSRLLFPGLPNYKLGTLVHHFGFPSGTFHRAEEDSVYCGMLFCEILRVLTLRGEPCTPKHLQKLSGKPPLVFPQERGQLDLF